MTIFATLANRFSEIIGELLGSSEDGRNGW